MSKTTPQLHRAAPLTLLADSGGSSGGSGGGGGRIATLFQPPDDGSSDRPWAAIAVASAGAAAVAIPWARRGIRFWLGVAPILLSYALLLLRSAALRCSEDERQIRLAAHHERCAPAALRLVQRLAGGYIKMGQVLSNRADLLPLPYVLANPPGDLRLHAADRLFVLAPPAAEPTPGDRLLVDTIGQIQ